MLPGKPIDAPGLLQIVTTHAQTEGLRTLLDGRGQAAVHTVGFVIVPLRLEKKSDFFPQAPLGQLGADQGGGFRKSVGICAAQEFQQDLAAGGVQQGMYPLEQQQAAAIAGDPVQAQGRGLVQRSGAIDDFQDGRPAGFIVAAWMKLQFYAPSAGHPSIPLAPFFKERAGLGKAFHQQVQARL